MIIFCANLFFWVSKTTRPLLLFSINFEEPLGNQGIWMEGATNHMAWYTMCTVIVVDFTPNEAVTKKSTNMRQIYSGYRAWSSSFSSKPFQYIVYGYPELWMYVANTFLHDIITSPELLQKLDSSFETLNNKEHEMVLSNNWSVNPRVV